MPNITADLRKHLDQLSRRGDDDELDVAGLNSSASEICELLRNECDSRGITSAPTTGDSLPTKLLNALANAEMVRLNAQQLLGGAGADGPVMEDILRRCRDALVDSLGEAITALSD